MILYRGTGLFDWFPIFLHLWCFEKCAKVVNFSKDHINEQVCKCGKVVEFISLSIVFGGQRPGRQRHERLAEFI